MIKRLSAKGEIQHTIDISPSVICPILLMLATQIVIWIKKTAYLLHRELNLANILEVALSLVDITGGTTIFLHAPIYVSIEDESRYKKYSQIIGSAIASVTKVSINSLHVYIRCSLRDICEP